MSEERVAYAAEREVFSPSALVRRVRDLLERQFPLLWIEGEISNFSKPASGHMYFSLKDAQSQVRCAMFKLKASLLRFRPADGQRVLARVRVGLYEARGEFQLIVEHMEQAGEGALLREFELLKARLSAEGLFDVASKRALPRLPRRIGVITSPTGAAIRDVLSVIARRFPMAEVEVMPVPVQGREAPAAIIAMLKAAVSAARHDVLLLTRGGGSLEDLWAFNHEGLARAIRACAIPVVSAIGHEIDFTIADFVADLRAPTPSAAAELLVPDQADLLRFARTRRERLARHMQHLLHKLAQRVDHAHARLRTQHPQRRLRVGAERLAQLRARLASQHPRRRVRIGAERLAQLRARLTAQHPAALLTRHRNHLRAGKQRLRSALQRRLDAGNARLSEFARALHTVSPLATLQRGYAILIDPSGHVVRSPDQAPPGTLLRARVAQGELAVRSERREKS